MASEPDSNSGMNLFRAAVAPIAAGARFFRSVQFSGCHRRSVELVAEGEADVTAVDCVTWAHLRRLEPALARRLRIVGWTPPSPCLPFVTSSHTDAGAIRAVQSALVHVLADPALEQVRNHLFLDGVCASRDAALTHVRELEIAAAQWRYPALL